MGSSKKGTSLLTESGIGLLIVLVVGGGLGVLFSGDLYNKPPHELMKALGLGLVWAALLVTWADIVIQSLGLTSDPVPDTLEISDTESVTEYLSSPAGSSGLAVRCHRLLESIANGASGAQVAQQAGNQSRQAQSGLNSLALFSLILIGGSLWDGGNTLLSWAALLLLAITIVAKRNLLSKIDTYIETSVLSRATAGGGSAEKPSSSKSGDQVVAAIDGAFKGLRDDLRTLSVSVGGFGEQMNSVGGSWGQDLSGILAQHSDAIQSTNQHLSTQLDRILSIQQDVEKVLHVGEAMDKVAASLSATAEFTNTLEALRIHVEESDKLLRELSKPRKIRLVEKTL